MVQDISKSIEACAAYYGKDAGAVRQYLTQGQERALALPNRGPLRFDQQGAIEQDILDAYSTYGFYIFEKLEKWTFKIHFRHFKPTQPYQN